MDNLAVEYFHWSGHVKEILMRGNVRAIKDLDMNSIDPQANKAIFCICETLTGTNMDKVRQIVESHNFNRILVYCSVPEYLYNESGEDEGIFAFLAEELERRMGKPMAMAEIIFLPMFHTYIFSDFFITPTFSTFFPLLPTDAKRLNEFYNSQGDKRNIQSLSDITLTLLPPPLQERIKVFAALLDGMFDEMSIAEDCYCVGATSRFVATELANLQSQRSKKKIAKQKASIILVDRTLDVATSVNHTCETLGNKIFGLLPTLPGHHSDVAVEMSCLCAHDSFNAVPGCLAHVDSPIGKTLLQSFLTKRSKESIMEVSRALVSAISDERLPLEISPKAGQITSEKLLNLVKLFKDNSVAYSKYADLLQYAIAVTNATSIEKNKSWEKLLGIEKMLALRLSDTSDRSEAMSILKDLVELNVKKLKRGISVEDILLLILFSCSLVGEEFCLKYSELESLVFKVAFADENPHESIQLFGEDVSIESFKSYMKTFHNNVLGLSEARSQLRQFRDLLKVGGQQNLNYQSINKQILNAIFDPKKVELIDVENKSSGLRDFIKSGFSLFMNVSKPRPNDHPLLFLFVIGGITCDELKSLNELVTSQYPNIKVIIGSTRLLKPDDICIQILKEDNLFI
ncbi:uncharacterized protein TRIADDRAFT_53138 [Trichoplax adhaerens]|uniref:Sec1 family domain-containing protein 2 n=1 Tax=Trichoplax adhaerens TaxID=10228 RepID=B3RNE7_TRIAD|nr:hypothetical protein TRIADDRAFT_53138 [Trichoplax adhaerens]EDV27439.1 hypothetical protein TRIADDRAFT_53138 [Trichoplax adhaerens]|eukprot:XP_002109273.1 hypothetical protein TRIADDRAFT_53138 [Trichoplax adhaerens]